MDLRKDFSTFFLQKVRNKLVILEDERKKALNLFWMVEIILILITFAFFKKASTSFPIQLLHFPLIVLIGLSGLNLKFSFSGYRKKYKDRILEILFEEILEDFLFSPFQHLSEDEYTSSLLYQGNYNEFKGEDLIEGKLDGVLFRMSELHVKYTESSSRNRKTYTIFKGLLIVSPGTYQFSSTTIVEPDQLESTLGTIVSQFLRKAQRSDYELVYLESPEFEREFVVRGSDQVDARRVLTPRMQEQLVNIKKRSQLKFGMSLANNQVSLAVPTHKNYFEPPYFHSCIESRSLKEIIQLFELLRSIHQELRAL